ncbi:uncharacterized protein KGF55_004383 [Candida pseudojiufengensis]|uniref:uncharacterized protein n=1 Tax=Candida pseudojiufengensis TaxID=497109 RepID=UPI00222406EF|nr:uncharacterized protein KGF55_004383 [Candida pseudojiufengensis]KAI5960813.1 hypothetical protein KGF55_004383 [Candida pseudojiufengensis]
MYIPKKNLKENWEEVEYLIENYPLATIITIDEGSIIANHIPFVLKIDESGGSKKLLAHIAKSNHQIPSLKSNDNVVVIFQSINSYITPEYYPTKQETHKVVPTWDFASVHIHGISKIIDDFEFVRNQLNLLADQEEGKKPTNQKKWKVNEAPENYLKIMQKNIVGLEIEITSFECKYKLQQDMRKQDLDGVIEGLANDNKIELSELTKKTNYEDTQ